MEIPTRVGYKFTGWSLDGVFHTDENGNCVKTFNETFNITIFTANRSKIYTINYELDGGTTANVTEYTIERETIVLSNPTKDHYDFVEWQLDGKKATDIVKIMAERGIKNRKENTSDLGSYILLYIP